MNQFRTMFGFNTQLIYYLRQNPVNCIIPADSEMGGIYLGNIYSAYSLDILKKHNITAVLTVAAGTNLKYKPENDITHLIIMADDIDHYNLSRHFERMADFIHKCRLEKRSILVHCFAGISRSTTTIVAYMMREMGWTFRKGISHCRSKRKEINPNPGFMRQLAQYERKLNSQKQKIEGEVMYPSISPNFNTNMNRSKSVNMNGGNGKGPYGTVRHSYNYNKPKQNYQTGQNIFMSGRKMPIGMKQQQQQQQEQNQDQQENKTPKNGQQKNITTLPFSDQGSPQVKKNGMNLMGKQYQVHIQKYGQQQTQYNTSKGNNIRFSQNSTQYKTNMYGGSKAYMQQNKLNKVYGRPMNQQVKQNNLFKGDNNNMYRVNYQSKK